LEEILDKLQREGLKLTSTNRRALAFFIDDMLISFLIFVAFYNKLSTTTSIEDVLVLVDSMFVYIVAIKTLYQAFFVWQYGGTLGKIFLKMQVVDEKSFVRLSFGQSLIRAIVRVASEGLFYLGFLWGVLSPTKQTWQDKIAKSLVVDA